MAENPWGVVFEFEVILCGGRKFVASSIEVLVLCAS